MRFEHRDGGKFGAISLPTSLYDEAPIDGDGYFVVPDTDEDACAAIARAGHTPVGEDGDALPDEQLPAPVAEALAEADARFEAEAEQREAEQAVEEEDAGDEPDDELDDMERDELYSLYKDEGGPDSWNDVGADDMRQWLRENGDY